MLPSLLTLAIGVVIASALFYFLRDLERQRARSEFEDHARLFTAALEREVAGHLDILRAVPAMQVLAGEAARSGPGHPASTALGLMFEEAPRRYPGVTGLGYAVPVAAENRDASRDRLGPGGIVDVDAGGRRYVPASPRPEHVPVLPLEQGGLPAFWRGLDLAGLPAVAPALAAARDSGRITISAPVLLPAPGGQIAGFVVILPLFVTGGTATVQAPEREAFNSYVVQLVDGAALLNSGPREYDGTLMQVWIEDVTPGEGSSWMTGAPTGAPVTSQSLSVGGRTWALRFSPATGGGLNGRQWPSWGALAGSLLLTLMASNYLWLVTNRARRIGALAAERAREITERERAEMALRERESWFRALVQHSSDVVTVSGADGGIEWVSPSVERVLGHDPDLLQGASLLAFVHPADVAAAAEAMLTAVAGPGRHEPIALRVMHVAGSWRWLEVTTTNLLDDPVVRGLVHNARDITERRELEEELTRQAFSDSLTGLPNRALFQDRLRHALAAARRHEQEVAVIFLDLDGFKVINDSLGHHAGDALLVAVAARLLRTVRPSDTVARFGGDEFAVLAVGENGLTTAAVMAERLLQALAEPVSVEGRDVFIMASAGVALSDGVLAGPADLLRRADIALYRAKGAGKGRVTVFDGSMEAAVAGRLNLETDLRRALERNEFHLVYQPEVNVSAGTVAGVEALLRWQHPERGAVSPVEFVPLAEETGIIVSLGAWVLREACRQVAEWRRLGHVADGFTLSVNLSGRQLIQPDLVEVVSAVLAETEVPPAMLRLEITETVLMEDGPASTRTLERLKTLGVELAIDDFGTGYSSLAYLRRFPVDTVKVDRSFIAAVEDDPRVCAIVQTVTHLAHALGMRVTAEGIETQQQVRFVSEAGCDRGQGYYYYRPLPAGEVAVLLSAGRRQAA